MLNQLNFQIRDVDFASESAISKFNILAQSGSYVNESSKCCSTKCFKTFTIIMQNKAALSGFISSKFNIQILLLIHQIYLR